MKTAIRILAPDDASIYQKLRLHALRESPFAFCSSYEEEKDLSIPKVAECLCLHEHGVYIFGAFAESDLVGLLGLGREKRMKQAHACYIWGMYVLPERREKGIARELLNAGVALASGLKGVRQIRLAVNSNNRAAISLYRSCGFERYGVEPAAMQVDGKFFDEDLMILRLKRD